jgi:hypothetical protein
MDEELDRFKQLDLRQIAAWMDYVIDRRESSRNSTVMRKDHDKIIISRKADDHYTYWSPRSDEDRGTVIDFLQRRKGLNLAGVRRELRAWSNLPRPPLPRFFELGKTVKDVEAVRKRYDAMPVAKHHAYLEQERGIPAAVLMHPRFAGTIKADRYGAAVFGHVDADGLICGYELKNRGRTGTWTGFAPGGRKGLFLSNAGPEDRRLILTESATDALSYAAIFGDLEVSRYGSIAGRPTIAQRAIIRAAILGMPGGAEIVAATDADAAGRELAEGMKETFNACGRADLTFRRHEPAGGKDWNEALLARRRKQSLPCRTEEPHVA